MPSPSFYILFSCIVCAVLGSWGYFRHYAVSRPSIGVFNLKDIAILVLFILLVPYCYLLFPLWLVAGLLLLVTLSILYFVWEPVLHSYWKVWPIVLALLVADFGSAFLFGTKHTLFFAINNIVLVMVVIGITNLWAQSGMKARDAMVLGALLAVYDFIATVQLPLTNNLLTRLVGLPFTPLMAWGNGNSVLWIGLGDVLLATLFPLVMRKAFGRRIGIAAMVLILGIIGVMLAFPFKTPFPTMVVLGPLMVLLYLYCMRLRRQERTTWQYLQEEPLVTRCSRQAECADRKYDADNAGVRRTT